MRAACQVMGFHPSTYHCGKRQLDRHGPEILRPRSGGCAYGNQTSPLLDQRVIAFTLRCPSFGPARIAAELAQPAGRHHPIGQRVCQVLRRPAHTLASNGMGSWLLRSSTRAGTAYPTVPSDTELWQYTAIDVASATPGRLAE
jgi:hypothetical protein